MAMRTITISDESLSRIIAELVDAKKAIEYDAKEEGIDIETDADDDEKEVWTEICKALEELGA